jgi:hypothetical protein
MGGGVRTCPVRGPLAPWAAGFEAWLLARGFSSWTVGHRICLLAVLSRWLEREGVAAGDFSEERAEEFLTARRAAGCVTWVSSRCVALPLAYLREVGAVPTAVAVGVEGPLAGLLEDYREYLVRERGLAPSTIASYERVARLFLERRPDGLALDRLTAADVSGFLARECPRRSVSGARHLVADLRPLLRYLRVAGLITSPLVWAVPGVADLRDRSLPRGLEPTVVARLLAGCDRRRRVGTRDYSRPCTNGAPNAEANQTSPRSRPAKVDRSADTPSACSSQSTPRRHRSGRLPITTGEARHPAHAPAHQRDAAQSQERRHRDDRALARTREHPGHPHLRARRPSTQRESDRPNRPARRQARQIPTLRHAPRVPRKPLNMLNALSPEIALSRQIPTIQTASST